MTLLKGIIAEKWNKWNVKKEKERTLADHNHLTYTRPARYPTNPEPVLSELTGVQQKTN